MGYVIYKQQQSENDGRKNNKQIISSGSKRLPVRFSHKQIISAWKELPDKERLIVFLVDIRRLSVEKMAEIMNRPVAVVKEELEQARALVKEKLLS